MPVAQLLEYVGGGLDVEFDETVLPWRSTDLSLALGVDPTDFEPKHSALADARWAKALYEKIPNIPHESAPEGGEEEGGGGGGDHLPGVV